MFNNLSCLLIRGITETLKCLNILILTLAVLGLTYSGKECFGIIALSGIVLYILTTVAISFINKNNNKRNIKFFITMILNFIISFLIIKNVPWSHKPYCVLYFLGIILFASSHYGDKINDVDGFIKKYIYSTLLFLSTIFALQGVEHFEAIKIYFPLYIIMSIVYIIQVNILEEYNDVSANLINENKNINRFNLVSIWITIISVLVFTTDFFKRIYNFSTIALETLEYIILKPVSWVMMLWYGSFPKKGRETVKYLDNIKDDENNKKLMEESLKEQGTKQDIIYENNVAVMVVKIFIITIFIVLVCFIIYKIYKKVMKIEMNYDQLDSLDGEERSFIFRKDKSEKRKVLKTKNVRDLHVIRQIYIDVIKILSTKGVEYKKFYTPNEYNSLIENTNLKSKNIGELVNIYNHLRYGGKPVSKDDISRAYKIKDNL